MGAIEPNMGQKSMMKKYFWVFLAVVFTLSAGCARRERALPANELPMYGGVAVPPEDLAADSKANEDSVRQTGTKDGAVKKTIEEAWASYQRGYFELAMRRFNRAWLMDPTNPEVFNGFAQILSAQKNYDGAIDVYKKYLEVSPGHGLTLCLMARQFQYKMVEKLTEPPSSAKKKAEAQRYFDEALKLYQEAALKATLDEDLSFIYYQWAIALAIKRDYKEAWEKVHLSKKYGGEPIEKEFIQSLSKDMPDPVPETAAIS